MAVVSSSSSRSSSPSSSSLQHPNPHRSRRTTRDLVKYVLLLCLIASLASLTAHTLPHLQRVLDNSAIIIHRSNDMPFLLTTGISTTTSSSFGHTEEKQQQLSIVQQQDACWNHKHVTIVNASRVAPVENQEDSSSSSATTSVLIQPSSAVCGRLLRNWTRVELLSPLAKRLQAHQSNCSLPVAVDYMDNTYGMGSHLVVWSQAMCNAMQDGYRIQSYNPTWLWMDQTYCSVEQAIQSPLLCYFPMAEHQCDERHTILPTVNVTNPRDKGLRCDLVKENLAEYRAAAMEYLFQAVSPLVVKEAQRQMGLLFGSSSDNDVIVPDDLITVHMRWGDKFWEMDLPSEHEYVAAVCQLLHPDKNFNCNSTAANIYLSTEDPRAAQAFTTAAPRGWKIYTDRTVPELNAYRPQKGNRASWTTKNTNGRAGLVALGSLLVALEANRFVLTTQSNWSRLMNELVKNVIDPRCGNCTRVIDLRRGQW